MTPSKNIKANPGSQFSATVPYAAEAFPDHAGLITNVHVVVVQIRGTDAAPRYRRRVLFNLPAAQRALDRATMHGMDASIILCQLVPVSGEK